MEHEALRVTQDENYHNNNNSSNHKQGHTQQQQERQRIEGFGHQPFQYKVPKFSPFNQSTMIEQSPRSWTTNHSTTTTTKRTRTRRTSSSSSPSSVSVVSPSPSWKESLRQACISRARQKRRDLINRKRRQIDFSTCQEAVIATPAESVVEEELRNQGLGMYSSNDGENVQIVPSNGNYMFEAEQETEENRRFTPHPDAMEIEDDQQEIMEVFALSDEDLLKILHDVEEELRQDEEELLEEILETENDYVETQIAEFEAWEEAQESNEMAVLCPVCQSSYLCEVSNQLVCCSDGACSVTGLSTPQSPSPLLYVREKLRLTYEEHASDCVGVLSFCYDSHRRSLIASCQECNFNRSLFGE